MNYINRINKIIKDIPKELWASSYKRNKRKPTQVSSEFLTNKEQGDWAEKTLMDAMNSSCSDYIAVKYGKDDDIVAGEEGFDAFYDQYQEELVTIGKRPDILIFKSANYPYKEKNISHLDRTELDYIVPKALCGIEVRSSAFCYEEYEKQVGEWYQSIVEKIIKIKDELVNNYENVFREKKAMELFEIIKFISDENVKEISFSRPRWSRQDEKVCRVLDLLKEIKELIQMIQKRNFLSITPKVEDLYVVHRWVEKYGVPHFYVQVFLDQAYGISYEEILTLISKPELIHEKYYVEDDVKNQHKTTIKIACKLGKKILSEIELPKCKAQRKELGKGRQLFYVTFESSRAKLDKIAFEELFGLT